MVFEYVPHGVCSQMITVELDGDIIKSVKILGGCPGNSLGVARLVEGMKVKNTIRMLRGIRCGSKQTSCPDQLSYALEEAYEKENMNKLSYTK